ncbi:MAG: AAA family ATPase [Chitinophagales bacterium]|nr:AAA family ATPase [Chitinophagales bacterium]
MRLLYQQGEIENLDDFDSGHTGIELVYDDRPYKVMESAIKEVIIAKSDLVSDLKQVLFGNKTTFPRLPIVTTELKQSISSKLNESQVKAVLSSADAYPVSIIHGPPGTGKTTTVVELISLLSKTEKKILVCAASNNATDLLAERLDEKGLKVLRIGNITRISDRMMHLTLDEQIRGHQDWAHIKKIKIQAQEADRMAARFRRSFGHEEKVERREWKKEARSLRKYASDIEDRITDDIISEARVIVTTLIGVSNKVIESIHYNTCIIDEASQALEPECWNAILRSDRVILAGDHKQLPPTVKSSAAEQLGLGITMMDLLVDKIDHVFMLNVQYRMNNSILQFSNERFYGGALISDDFVGTRTLRNDSKPLIFIDTAGAGFEETLLPPNNSLANHGEFFVLREHLLRNLESFLGASIGIISPYSAQVKYIKEEIAGDAELTSLNIDVNSIDGFQGQEREIIYISLVRSNDDGEIGFLKDERRLNVAMTRAQKKLIVIGDSATIAVPPLYQDLIRHIEQYGHYDSVWNYMSY